MVSTFFMSVWCKKFFTKLLLVIWMFNFRFMMFICIWLFFNVFFEVDLIGVHVLWLLFAFCADDSIIWSLMLLV